MAYPQYDKVDIIDHISYAPGPYYSNGSLTGYVDLHHWNYFSFPIESLSHFTVRIYSQAGVQVRYNDYTGYLYELQSGEEVLQVNAPWTISLNGLAPGTYYTWIEKTSEPTIRWQGPNFAIQAPASSEKSILSFFFYRYDGNNNAVWPSGIGDTIYGNINQLTRAISFQYPTGMDVTALAPRITVSPNATILPASLSPEDFSTAVVYRVTAQDLSFNDYTVTGTAVGEASLFIYDNIYTRVVPDTLERGNTINWFCLLANSGTIANGGTENLTVVLSDDNAGYYAQIFQGPVGVIDPYEDKEMTGSYQIPSNVPLGSDIPYYISFHLNNSLVKRYLLISNWDETAKGIVYSKPIGAFVRETSSRSKFFANINKDFYSLGRQEGSNLFWYHNDNIADGNIMLYGEMFYPSVTFIVNKTKVEKIYDNIIMQMTNVGITRIEYWTETQYAIHEWPTDPLNQSQARPWIDPEFREDKWYFPVHNEEIADYDYVADGNQTDGVRIAVRNTIPLNARDSGTIFVISGGITHRLEYVALDHVTNDFILASNRGFAITDGDVVLGTQGDLSRTREMRGTYLKVKITFKPLRKFTLKNVLTEFRESNI